MKPFGPRRKEPAACCLHPSLLAPPWEMQKQQKAKGPKPAWVSTGMHKHLSASQPLPKPTQPLIHRVGHCHRLESPTPFPPAPPHCFPSCHSNRGSQLKWVDLQDFHFTRRFQLLHALFLFGFRTKKPKSSRTLSSDELSNSETARNQNFPLTLLRSHFAISLFHFSILDYFELFLQHFPMLNATLSITQHSYEGVIM